jgi:hypothetical protein
MAEWHTEESARNEWADAPIDYGDEGDATLATLLVVAKQAVVAFAPAVEEPLEDDNVPEGYRAAQLMQARNIWNASKASPSGDIDGGQYGIAAGFPLDWQVRQLIRPKRGRPVLG